MNKRTFLYRASSIALGATLLPNCLVAKGLETNKSTWWEFLNPGDTIDVIAPSSPVDNPHERYQKIHKYFSKTPYKVNIPIDMIEPTIPLDEANTIEKRAKFIYDAFESDSKAIWAIGGGGWATSILNTVKKYPRPKKVKPILGYSDVTALHVLSNQYWGFPSLHCVVLGINGDISPGWNENGINEVLDVLSGKTPELTYFFRPLNYLSSRITELSGRIVGGNSLLVSALNGTIDYTLQTKNKFLFIESIASNPGRFSRMLMGLTYSPIIQQSHGVIFGDIIQDGGSPNPPDIQAQYDYIIDRFANQYIPNKIVVKADNMFGHGSKNLPLPLNTMCTISTQGGMVKAVISANKYGNI